MDSAAGSPGRSVLVVSRCSLEFGGSQGGADVLAYRHAAVLARSGVAVCLVSGLNLTLPNDGEVVKVCPTQVLYSRPNAGKLNPLFLLNEFFNVVRGALRGLRVLRTRTFDLVVTNHSVATLMTRIRRPHQRVVHYVHDGLHAHRYVSGFARKLTRFVLNDVLEVLAARVADRDLCASTGILHQLREFGVPASKTVAIAPLVGSLATNAKGTPMSLPNADFAPYVPYVLSVGQQSGRKRFDVLIQAMKEVPSNVSLVLVGDGPAHDSYRELAKQEKLVDRIRFLRGVSDDQLAQLYSRAELFALVSENEGFPITVAEARAMGRPVLVASPAAGSWSEEEDAGLNVIPYIPAPMELGKRLAAVLASYWAGNSGRKDSPRVALTKRVREGDVVATYAEFLALH